MASFNFPSTPALNDTYSPVGGPVFTWDGTAWKGTSQGAPVTVYVSDTAPLSPAIGQLWWNSATGTMAIWYADSDSAQWVQVSGQVLPTAPSDNGEYVMVNGVWRLVRQSFNMTGLSTLDITVPAWGPKMARFSSAIVFPSLTTERMTVSADGTTFLAGASDYSYMHFTSLTGSGGAAAVASGSTTGINYGVASDNANIPHMSEAMFRLVHPTGYVSCQIHATGHYSIAANLHTTSLMRYYVNGFPAGTPIKAFRWFTSAVLAASSGEMTVDWLQ